MKELKELLKAMGLKEDQIAKYLSEDKEVLKDLKPKEDANALIDHQKEVLQNDPAFMDPIKAQVRAAVLTSKEKKFIKAVGLTDDDLEGLPENTRFDSMIEKGVEKLQAKVEAAKKEAKGKASPEAAKQIEELNAQLKESKDLIKEYNETKIPELEKSAENKVKQLKLEYGILGKLQEKTEDLVVKPAFAIGALQQHLNAKFTVTRDDTGKLGIMQKEDPTMKVFKDNQPWTIEQEIDSFLKDNSLLKQSNPPGGGGGKGEGKPPEGGGGGKGDDETPAMKKARERLAEIKGETNDED